MKGFAFGVVSMRPPMDLGGLFKLLLVRLPVPVGGFSALDPMCVQK